jgi:hypothetical protein
MVATNITRTNFRVADFLSWQKGGELQLSPAFQRRSVWNKSQKSFLIDTVVRGLPIPIVFIRDSINLEDRTSIKEMVDGQQRIRSLLAFVDPSCLPDYDPTRDAFTLRTVHNGPLADKPFERLPTSVQRDILAYEMSTHILPLEFEDREVLQVFARMNSTGLKLAPQELRNAQFAGDFKTVAFELATEQLDRWRSWRVFTEDQISRMKEVEVVSDLLMNIVNGLTGKTQKRIDKFYADHEAEWKDGTGVATRFRHTMETIDKLLGSSFRSTAWRSEVNFFTLFCVVYDLEWGLGANLTKKVPSKLPSDTRKRVLEIGRDLREGNVPKKVLDAMQRASADLGRRRTRFEYVKHALETS